MLAFWMIDIGDTGAWYRMGIGIVFNRLGRRWEASCYMRDKGFPLEASEKQGADGAQACSMLDYCGFLPNR